MARLLIFSFLILFDFLLSQNLNPDKLHQDIARLNNDKKYKESIIKLEDIINSSKYTNFDKYHAYLEKSFTYKSLYNYSGAVENLNQALYIGQKTNRKEEVETTILVEKLFIAFDLQNDSKTNLYLSKIKPENLYLLNETTHAFYLSVLAVIDMRKDRLSEAEKKLDEAIELLKLENEKDLPNIYRKKVKLYSLLNDNQKAIEAYEKGLFYANKHNIRIYQIVMDESLTQFYIDKNDYKKALEFQQKVNKKRTDYNHVSQVGELNILEKDLLQKRKNLEVDYEKKLRIFFIATTIILAILVYVLIRLYKTNKAKGKLVERENIRMRKDLEELISEKNNNSSRETINLTNYNLTSRQIEIIELVKNGKTNKEIAGLLFISENTVKYHLKIIYNVLNIDNRYELIQEN